MTLRRLSSALLFLLVAALPAAAADFTTDNFAVDAPTKELARTFGEYAEKYRREKAIEWLGTEMPRWQRRCPLKVSVTPGHTGGATTFTFGVGRSGPAVMSQEMKIFGGMEQLLHSVLPHEVTHTVLAHHFGQAVPRWADEGGSVLSENDEERFSHDVRCREILNQGRGIPLRMLLPMKEYPPDMIVLYAQGYSITDYLVSLGGRRKFLQFIGEGMRGDSRNWEEAVRTVYGDRFASVDELQESWIAALRNPPQRIAARNETDRDAPPARRRDDRALASAAGGGKGGIETRSSAAAGLPELEPPVIVRGATPERGNRAFDGSPVSTTSDRVDAAPANYRKVPLPTLLPPEPPSRR